MEITKEIGRVGIMQMSLAFCADTYHEYMQCRV